MQKIYVTCSICGHKYEAKVPKGGDGSMFVPRMHSIKIPTHYLSYANGEPRYRKETCSGSWQEGIDIK